MGRLVRWNDAQPRARWLDRAQRPGRRSGGPARPPAEGAGHRVAARLRHLRRTPRPHVNAGRRSDALRRPAYAIQPKGTPMTSLRKTAFVAGMLYLITYLAIPTIALYGPVLSDPAFIVSSSSDTGVLWGAVLELIVAFAIVGTGVVLFPVLRRQSEG